jgi:SagB-type dehydrogenase family enzyme
VITAERRRPILHALCRRGDTDVASFHALATLADPVPATGVTVALVATFARTRAKYGLRGYRFALLEAGHLAQALITNATALGLRTLPWGGFLDGLVDAALDLDGVERSCLYLVGVSRERCA